MKQVQVKLTGGSIAMHCVDRILRTGRESLREKAAVGIQDADER